MAKNSTIYALLTAFGVLTASFREIGRAHV